jgi:hypothetical protein
MRIAKVDLLPATQRFHRSKTIGKHELRYGGGELQQLWDEGFGLERKTRQQAFSQRSLSSIFDDKRPL